MRYPGPEAGSDLEPIALLKPRQITALEALLSGATVKEAAEEAGVHRSTVHRWQRRNLAFRAVYNRRLLELQQSAVTRVHQMVHSALDQLEEDLAAGELSSSEALRFLESAGFLSGTMPEPGPVSVDAMLHEAVDRLVERTSPEEAREWIDLINTWAEEGYLPSDGSFRGIRATAKRALQKLEEDEVRVEDLGLDFEGDRFVLLRALADDASPEAIEEWTGVLEEVQDPGSDLTGTSAWAFWLTLVEMVQEAESDVAESEGAEEPVPDIEHDEVA